MDEMGRDPHFDSYMKVYPPQNLGKTVAELTGRK